MKKKSEKKLKQAENRLVKSNLAGSYVSAEDVCRVLKISRATLYNWRSKGAPAKMLNDRAYYRIDSVLNWRKNNFRDGRGRPAKIINNSNGGEK